MKIIDEGQMVVSFLEELLISVFPFFFKELR